MQKKLTIEEQLMLTLKYNRQCVTQKELAFEFEIGEAIVEKAQGRQTDR